MAAKKRRAGHKVVFVEAPQDLAERLAAVADYNRRSTTAEAIVAFERHVKAEEVRIRAEMAEQAQPLPPVQPAGEPSLKRGRRKGGTA